MADQVLCLLWIFLREASSVGENYCILAIGLVSGHHETRGAQRLVCRTDTPDQRARWFFAVAGIHHDGILSSVSADRLLSNSALVCILCKDERVFRNIGPRSQRIGVLPCSDDHRS